MWIKLDDEFPDHPEVTGLSDRAFRALVTGHCYAGLFLTDGRISTKSLRGIATPKVIVELVDAGLWHQTDDGIEIHDFLQYNPPRAKVDEERAASAERQRRWRETHRDEDGRFTSNGV
jgi:hypothetical protein